MPPCPPGEAWQTLHRRNPSDRSREPGQLIRGLRPNRNFYLFATYTDADGKVSKPSRPYKINLEDFFAMK